LTVYDDPVDVDSRLRDPSTAAGSPQRADEQSSPALVRFRSCRWRRPAENGSPECCVHRDVLPLAGTHGFDAEAWCVECGFYKLRRTPKKRSPDEYYY
jgi:hypothetical protein